MTDTQARSTELTSQYIAQVTGDLERNVKEQERIGTEIEALQEQLQALQHDHTVLVTMQQALSAGNIAAAESVARLDTKATPTVPHQATAEPKQAKSEPKQSKAKKAVSASARKPAAKKPATKAPAKAPAAKKSSPSAKTSSTKASSTGKPAAKTAAPAAEKADKAAAKPTLVELIRGHLEQQSEPRSAAEIATALTQAHPDRSIKTTVVRTTLEGLVAKSHAHRSKQGSSVFYTAATSPEQASASDAPQTEAAAG
ncbi:BlaI/MecI/CopY family transcriptional regulator [Streptomyces sp. NPDC005496]|uniref:BlaI/MecI/CopY family transcriptional regulator n=1 Tax=unclassified Streptomyces TaxID=2593676 RepID=UPI0033BF77F8